jgi:endonuclease G
MRESFEVRLRQAVGELTRSDPRLAQELGDVRSKVRRAGSPEMDMVVESIPATNGADRSELALETIVLRTGRPVLAIVDGKPVLDFNDADSEVWRERLLAVREGVERAIFGVGRIEVDNHDLDWVGTGWLVAPDVIVTNRHVASEFAARRGDRFVFRQGVAGTMAANIDFLEELGRDKNSTFELSSVLHIESESGPDVAFLRVEQLAGPNAGAQIRLARATPSAAENVAVIGYPARDSRIPEQDLMLQIFGNVFDKKRLAPGRIKSVRPDLLLHDCSTLGGNSGSVVLGLDTGEALALHFSGRFLESNFAVPAATVARLLERIQNGEGHSRSFGGLPARTQVPSERPRASTADRAATTGLSFTIPIRVRIDVGTPEPEISRAPTRSSTLGTSNRGTNGVASKHELEDGEAIEEGRPEDYANREGYRADFFGDSGPELPLPDVENDSDVLAFRVNGRRQRALAYEHFSVVMSERRRLCYFSAVNIDGRQSRKQKRTAWRVDPRIPREQQVSNGVYGNAPKFSRGHMTRREDPVWGTPRSAALGNSDSMHLTNAVPQMQPFNAGIWLGLEDYALDNAREDDMRICVLTGPVFEDDDPELFGVQIPRTFWKLIAFIHDETGELSATGYTMSQAGFLREEEFVFGQHETAQVPLSIIESLAGISFSPELVRLDPLERALESRARRLESFEQIRFR